MTPKSPAGRPSFSRSIARKGLLILIIPVLTIGGFALASRVLESVQSKASGRLIHAAETRGEVSAAKAALLESVFNARSFVLSGDTTYADLYRASQAQSLNLLEDIAESESAEHAAILASARSAADRSFATLDEIVSWSPTSETKTELTDRLRGPQTDVDEARRHLDQLVALDESSLTAATNDLQATEAIEIKLLIALVTLGLVGGVWSWRRFTVDVTDRLVKLQQNASLLATGEVLTPLPESKDEIGELDKLMQNAAQLLNERERALLDTKNLMDERLSVLPGAIYSARVDDMTVTYLSPSWEPMTGYSAADSQTVFAMDRIHPDDVPALLAETPAEDGESSTLAFRFKHADGSYRWMETVYTSHDGIAVGYIRDITTAKLTAIQLKESQELARSIIQASNDGFNSVDAEGTIEDWNPAAERMFGWSREEAIGRSLWETVVPPDHREEMRGEIQRYLKGADDTFVGRRIEVEGLHRDGSPVPLELLVIPLETNGVTRFHAFMSDIADRKRADAAIREARDTAERANRAKSEFLSRMSHELRTPMNAIMGFSQLLESEHLDASMRESVGHISSAGRHLLDLINEVLDLSRIEAGKLALSLEPVGLTQVLEEALGLVRSLVEAKDITVVDETASLDASVRVDRQRLKQILINLLSNAAKYNVEGGRITIRARRDESVLFLSIEDTGRGLRSEQLSALFKPFERLGAETTTVEGTGLGLAVTQKLLEAMDGTISVESEVGVGSTFSIRLPIATQVDPVVVAEATAEASMDLSEKGRLLYIEDNPSNLRLVERILASRPELELITATNGELGIELATSEIPDLILLDLNLPDRSGLEILGELKAGRVTKDIPVVMVTADASPGQDRRFRAAGADDYVTKPLDIKQLFRVIETQLSRRDAA
ncbi:MAG: hypothetical protein QOG54_1130 [Actinomycetota bacterium]|jgi:PAS domain S-box-containing protein|nr:hypothetical protein [Actinomycetota bacterium]